MIRAQPVESDPGDGLPVGAELAGLPDVAVRAKLVAGTQVGLEPRRGEPHDGNGARARASLDRAEDVQPAYFREVELEQDKGGRGLPGPRGEGTAVEEEAECGFAVGNQVHVAG